MTSDLPALRMVHLSGGLRAFDYGDTPIDVQAGEELTIASFVRPKYAQLYSGLSQLGLAPIGVDFFKHDLEARGLLPPDWRVFNIKEGFSAYEVEHAWGGVRNVKSQQIDEVIDIAGRFRTYLRLLNLRVREISEAYHLALRCKLLMAKEAGRPVRPGLSAGGYLTYIEAAVHAFLADAAALRDLIAEATWGLVLKRSDHIVTSQAGFLKRTKAETHPLAIEIQQAGEQGGWIKNLTDLRNAVIHIAPMADAHELHMLDLRVREAAGTQAPYVHFPLTTKQGGVRERPPRMRGGQEELAARLQEYAAFVAESGDALEYAAATFRQLAHLSDRVRLAAGLSTETMVFDKSNIIGPVKITRRVVPHGEQAT